MKNSINYLNNGKIAQNSPIKSTRIKSSNKLDNNFTNGKLFNKELAVAFKENNIKKSNSNNNENSSFTSWLMSTLNPINHIPVISTINNMVNQTSKSLDILQSAIGGALYGGGPIGLAKGIGSWVFNKLVPKNEVANNPKIKEVIPSNKSNILKENVTNPKEPIQKSKVNLQINDKVFSKINNERATQNKFVNPNFLNYYSVESKQKKNIIDTDA